MKEGSGKLEPLSLAPENNETGWRRYAQEVTGRGHRRRDGSPFSKLRGPEKSRNLEVGGF